MADRSIKAEASEIVNFLLEGVNVQKGRIDEGTIVIYNGGEDPQVIDQKNGGKPTMNTRQMTINGKRWHFEITRNEEGQITGLDVEQR